MGIINKTLSTIIGTPATLRLDQTLDGLSQIAMHEAGALDRHVLAVRERANVARKARTLGELVRNQFDLLPATTARLAQDHRERRRLLRGLVGGDDIQSEGDDRGRNADA